MSLLAAGSEINLQLREAGTTGAYQDVICEVTSTASGSANVTTEVTKCGTFSTVATPIYTFTIEGLAEFTGGDTSNIGINDLLQYFNNKTKLDLIFQYPSIGILDGVALKIQGLGYMTELSITAPSEGNVGFTASFQLTGTIDTTY